MQGHHAILINNIEEARISLKSINVDIKGLEYMTPKALFKCIKLKEINCKAANLIKQEMLAKGGEAAVARDTVNAEGVTDVLLMGTLKQYRLLTQKLKQQPFGLKQVAEEIEFIIKALEPKSLQLRCANGRTINLGQGTKLMGILNITPDSFSDGGKYINPEKALLHAREMIEDGADIIDVGGASSRPDSVMASAAEEMERIIPVIEKLAKEDIIISVDTFRADVAEAALQAGAHIINDIGRLQLDPELIGVLVKYKSPVILMHNRMQFNINKSYQDLISDIVLELKQSINQAIEAGLDEDQLIIDPGVGFGKTVNENRLVIKRLSEFKSLGKPILLGTSRKSFIGKTLDLDVSERLEGSLATLVMGIMNGADIIRVHDVKASKRALIMTDAVMREDG